MEFDLDNLESGFYFVADVRANGTSNVLNVVRIHRNYDEVLILGDIHISLRSFIKMIQSGECILIEKIKVPHNSKYRRTK